MQKLAGEGGTPKDRALWKGQAVVKDFLGERSRRRGGFEFEYLHEIEIIFGKALGYETGTFLGSLEEKTTDEKSCDTEPLSSPSPT
jgi:hypothetical protein